MKLDVIENEASLLEFLNVTEMIFRYKEQCTLNTQSKQLQMYLINVDLTRTPYKGKWKTQEGNRKLQVTSWSLPFQAQQVPAVEKVELSEALGRVDSLEGLLQHGDPPSIEGMSPSIQCQVNFDTNFEDRNAYVTGVARYIEEATVHADMVRDGEREKERERLKRSVK